MVDSAAHLLYGAVAEALRPHVYGHKGGTAMVPGTRPNSSTGLALILVFGLLTAACQSAMSVEEAKQVPAHAPIAPPPRTVTEIIGILDRQGTDTPIAHLADASPPSSARVDALADFYVERGLAAGRIGRARQELDDLHKATEYFLQTVSPVEWIYRILALAEERDGNYFRYLRYLGMSMRGPWSVWQNDQLAIGYASIGDVRAAEVFLAEATRWYGSGPWLWSWTWITDRGFMHALAKAVLLDATGRHVEAEAVARKVIAWLVADREGARSPWAPTVDEVHAFLARALIRQGRLLEAESEAREAALGALATQQGRYSPHTAWMLRSLVWVLLEQGRYREAETLARAVIEIFEKTDVAPDSLRVATARADLARALELQGRDEESLGAYEVIRAGLRRDPESLEQFFRGNVPYAELLVKAGRVDQGLEMLGVALERSKRLVGETHRETAEIRGSLAQAYAAKGDSRRALHEFREASVGLAARVPDLDAEPTAARQRLVGILSSYIELLAAIEGSPLAREAGIDAIAESFRVADIARVGTVQRALGANAARAAARSPALAELVRVQQDANRKIRALYEELANTLSEPSDRANEKVAELRRRIEASRRILDALTVRIEKEFPAYAELVDPKPVTVDQARAMLRPGEALIATLVTKDRTFVWAMSRSGPVAFTAAPMSAKAIENTVATLRRALEPQAKTLEGIPEFDLVAAHRLYRALLEPVRHGWQDARSLLVVANGPLGQLPLALLPTGPTKLPPESGAIFANYRQVPWLVRRHAVTTLPSVASLAALRTIPPGDPNRRSFVGFGDPYFSREQATLAAEEHVTVTSTREAPPRDVVALTKRAVPIRLRGLSAAFPSSQLAKLPRLPETAEEIRDLAGATNADLVRDVILGARANEKAVKTLDLTRYRIVAFATHGLVPGDLEGLTQPALALSSPDVADVEGDGLLTMDKILSLRLDADWVVLSACNTASGQGAGSEAVSGLGRAFFYAGARALLVSNWPLETTSARALTTDLFRRQQHSPGVSRAHALQQTMNWLIDHGESVDAATGKTAFSYAHPIFWAPFTLIGDGDGRASVR
jgi:CHAT domain-containing protein